MKHSHVEPVTGDLRDVASWKGALQGVGAVIHAGALVGDSGKAADYEDVNVKGTIALTRAAKESGSVNRFILVSSLGVYPGRDHFGSDESVSINRSGLDAYTRSKAESEVQFLKEAQELGLVATALRPGFIYGERDRTVVPRLLDQLAKGRVVYFGSGDRKTNCIYVRNLSHAILLALEAKAEKIDGLAFNLTDDPSATKREFLEALAREAGLPPPRASIPRPLALTMAELSEFAAKIGLVKRPPVSKAAFKFLGLNLDYSIERAKSVLGYHPPFSFVEGIKATIAWFKEDRDTPHAALARGEAQ
jgi:nucleoside-diphosphate-sugar epimerase